jgi:hypothetical protein
MSPGLPGPGLPIDLDGGYRLALFAEQDAVTTEDVVAMWISEAEVDEEEARRRIAELLIVVTGPDGQLAAVSTAYVHRNNQLRCDVWHVRVFVSAGHRMSHLAIALAVATRDHFAQRFISGQDRRGIGVLFEVQNEVLKRRGVGKGSGAALGRWRRTDFFFIGENARGDHIRIHYFPGALAPEPDA